MLECYNYYNSMLHELEHHLISVHALIFLSLIQIAQSMQIYNFLSKLQGLLQISKIFGFIISILLKNKKVLCIRNLCKSITNMSY